MVWTLLEARTEIGVLKTELADSDVYPATSIWDAIDYLIAQAEKYQDLKAKLEDVIYEIQLRDSQE